MTFELSANRSVSLNVTTVSGSAGKFPHPFTSSHHTSPSHTFTPHLTLSHLHTTPQPLTHSLTHMLLTLIHSLSHSHTHSGTDDYVHFENTLQFSGNVNVTVDIIDDVALETAQEFTLTLVSDRVFFERSSVTITILDNDGTMQYFSNSFTTAAADSRGWRERVCNVCLPLVL